MIYKYILKRKIDIVLSLVGLIVLSPLFIIIIILIKTTSKGPIFYTQERYGKDFKLFKIIKFRSMVTNADKKGLLITKENDPRVTKFGRFLRKTKCDELPQLINTLKGNMSFIGPRPEVKKYVMIYRDDYKKILSISPGITDNASLQYINEEKLLNEEEDSEALYINTILPKKISLYKEYISDISIKKDFIILLKTIMKVLHKSST